jgi:hypothetical protein
LNLGGHYPGDSTARDNAFNELQNRVILPSKLRTETKARTP